MDQAGIGLSWQPRRPLAERDPRRAEDIAPPFVLADGHVAVLSWPGTGVEVLPDVLDRLTKNREVLT